MASVLRGDKVSAREKQGPSVGRTREETCIYLVHMPSRSWPTVKHTLLGRGMEAPITPDCPAFIKDISSTSATMKADFSGEPAVWIIHHLKPWCPLQPHANSSPFRVPFVVHVATSKTEQTVDSTDTTGVDCITYPLEVL